MTMRQPFGRVPQPIRYLFVGGTTLLLYLATSFGFARLGVPAALSASVAVLVSGAFNLMAHVRVTFPGASTDLSTAIRYGALLGANSLTAAGIVALSTHFGHGLALANALALIVVTTTSYFVLKHWILPAQNRLSS
ncbi:MAG: hypothetical protein C0511_09140 [Hyphomicrobium sp.]|nr:hypothetical protein [Hyphomicrobium sp.]